jgi:tetratricopeptide (TPR) repeat protein
MQGAIPESGEAAKMRPNPPHKLTPIEREQYARGRACFEQGQVDLALGSLTPLLSAQDGFADLHYMVGVLLDRRGEVPAAIERLRDAIRLNPRYSEALVALASVYERQGDFERSRSLSERASAAAGSQVGGLDATTRGKLANLQAAVGDAYSEVGELPEAIDAYRKALDRCPEFHDIRYRLGIALRETGLPHQAGLEFRRVLRGNPEMLEAQVQLGLTCYSLGRIGDARRLWSEVLERQPGRSDAEMYLRMISTEAAPEPQTQSPAAERVLGASR